MAYSHHTLGVPGLSVGAVGGLSSLMLNASIRFESAATALVTSAD